MVATINDVIARFTPRTKYPTDIEEAQRYVTTFSEPLLSLVDRTEAEMKMRQLCHIYPAWAAFWFAGSISSVMRTLPSADPWTNMHPLVTSSLGDQAHKDSRPRFGTHLDAIDLVDPMSDDPSTDSSLAAFASPIGDDAAKALAAGPHGWLITAEVLSRMTAPEGEYLYYVGDAALRRAIARRRQYLGRDDEMPTTALLQWGWWAVRIVKNGRDLPSTVDNLVDQERIPNEAYQPIWDEEDI